MDEKVARIIDSLVSMTEDGKLEWKYTNTENSYQLELDAATLVISFSEWVPLSNQDDCYSLIMYNGTGKPIELVSCSKNDDKPDEYSLLSRLYSLSKESTNKKNTTIDKILSELSLKDLPF